jgi:broad specificity phosphatase PhoE
MTLESSKAIFIMRHGERLDRSLESKGLDWISTAERPHDPPLSDHGILQAQEVGRQLKSCGIVKIISSPMIRTVMTANVLAEVLGLGSESICIEPGLVEEAKSFRGKDSSEPPPTWNPLILSSPLLFRFSDKINTSYIPILPVSHTFDATLPNGVREIFDEFTDRDVVTAQRCARLVRLLLANIDECHRVLLVTHGAVANHLSRALQGDIDPSLRISGSRTVSSWAEFVPVDARSLEGNWIASSKLWHPGGGVLPGGCEENSGDQGKYSRSYLSFCNAALI